MVDVTEYAFSHETTAAPQSNMQQTNENNWSHLNFMLSIQMAANAVAWHGLYGRRQCRRKSILSIFFSILFAKQTKHWLERNRPESCDSSSWSTRTVITRGEPLVGHVTHFFEDAASDVPRYQIIIIPLLDDIYIYIILLSLIVWKCNILYRPNVANWMAKMWRCSCSSDQALA